jgi:rhomboid protease GluP
MTEPTQPSEPRARATPAEPSLLERARAAPVTVAIIAIDFAVYGWAEHVGSTLENGTLLRFGAAEPLHVWAGEYWRVATCMFLHIGLVHILMNSYMAFGWATALERTIGKWRFLVIYLLSGVAGGCASVVSGILFGPRISAGASGALFGVLGATFAIRRRLFPSWSAFWADRGVRSVAIQVGIWTAIGFQIHLDNAAHLGGLVAGSLGAWLFTSPSAARSKGWLALAAGVAALFVFAARPWWSPTGDPAADRALRARLTHGSAPADLGDE